MKYLVLFLLVTSFVHGQIIDRFTKFPTGDAIGDLSPEFYFTPASIDPDVTTDGSSLSGNVWEDATGNGHHATIINGTFVLNIGSTGRQIEWTATGSLTLPVDAATDFAAGTDEITMIWRLGDNGIQSGSGYALSKAPSAVANRTGAAYSGSNDYGNLYVGGTTTNVGTNNGTANSLAIVIITTSQVDMWVDGTQIITAGSIGTGVDDSQAWNIGGRSNGAFEAASGNMFDIAALIKRAITTQERLDIFTQFQIN